MKSMLNNFQRILKTAKCLLATDLGKMDMIKKMNCTHINQ